MNRVDEKFLPRCYFYFYYSTLRYYWPWRVKVAKHWRMNDLFILLLFFLIGRNVCSWFLFLKPCDCIVFVYTNYNIVTVDNPVACGICSGFLELRPSVHMRDFWQIFIQNATKPSSSQLWGKKKYFRMVSNRRCTFRNGLRSVTSRSRSRTCKKIVYREKT